jgi:periplasmic nitrate reductase NapD
MSSSRRTFIHGHWHRSAVQASAEVEIASLIVTTWPQHLDRVSQDILALGNTEIHGRDSKGKLIVVLEEASQGAVGTKANAISGLPHVLSATMVFQASDNEA